MTIERILPVYIAVCVISIFIGISYKIGGVVLRPFDALVAGGALMALGRSAVRGKVDYVAKNKLYYLFLALYFYRCINALFLNGYAEAIKESIQVLEFIILIHLIAIVTRTEKDRGVFIQTFLVGCGVLGILVAGWHISNGMYANYKKLGDSKLIFSLFALLAVVRYMGAEKKKEGRALAVFAILLALLSGERKGWVALAGSVAIVYMVIQGVSLRKTLTRLLRPRIILVGSILAAIGIGVALQFEYVERQFTSMYDLYLIASEIELDVDLSQFETSGSNLARLYILLFAIRATLAHPIFGVGTGRWHNALNQMARTDDSRFMIGAHSEYQRLAVENGLTGLSLYITLWVLAIRRAVRFARLSLANQQSSALVVVGLTVFGALINFFLGGGALNTIYLALSVGLLLGLENDKELVKAQLKPVNV
jgi:O-antigen ligase